MTAHPLIIGIDLSGPSNHADTACAVFEAHPTRLVYRQHLTHLADADLLHIVSNVRASTLTIGIDAPLSYQDGGGDRPADADLRRRLKAFGSSVPAVMTPTMTRMAYLTLRGMGVARLLETAAPESSIVEVHPFASLVMAGADLDVVAHLKSDEQARQALLSWLPSQGLDGLPDASVSDHELAAFGASLAAWRWQLGQSPWKADAVPPQHPYPFAC